jgi:hypothetical protein
VLTDATAMAWVQQEADEAPAARHGDVATTRRRYCTVLFHYEESRVLDEQSGIFAVICPYYGVQTQIEAISVSVELFEPAIVANPSHRLFQAPGVIVQAKWMRSAMDQEIPMFRLHIFWAQK